MNPFVPDFRMTILRNDSKEVRLAGRNNYRALLFGYGGLLLLLIITGIGLYATSTSEEYFVFLLAFFLLFASTFYSYVLKNIWGKTYQKNEIRFNANGIWAKEGVGEGTTLSMDLVLEVYLTEEIFRFYRKREQRPLFEFLIPGLTNQPGLLKNIAKALDAHLELAVDMESKKKYKLLPKSSALISMAFEATKSTPEISESPNGLMKKLTHKSGVIAYFVNGQPGKTGPDISWPNRPGELIKHGFWKNAKKIYPYTTPVELRYELQKVEKTRFASEYKLELFLGEKKIVTKSYSSGKDELKQVLDIHEDVKVLRADLIQLLWQN
ncbi:MAG: hypothetical protein AAF433_21770 [Bacteroidota bacterium]